MKVVGIVLLGVVYFFVFTLGPTGARRYNGPRIVNGTDAASGEFPFMLGLLYKGYYTCGATILDEIWALTAAHCVYGRDVTMFSVVSGTCDMDGLSGEETPVIEVIIHEKYKPVSNLANDIAVLRLNTPLEFTQVVQPVTLPDYLQSINDDTSVTIMGWGYNKYKGEPMEKLQKATIYIVNNQACAVPYSAFMIDILPSHLCAGTPNGGVGQCTGDSGGPLVVKGNNQYTQYGIISFSAKPCGIKGYPGVFTRVPYLRNWIKDKTGC